jgi:hypothetical protein
LLSPLAPGSSAATQALVLGRAGFVSSHCAGTPHERLRRALLPVAAHQMAAVADLSAVNALVLKSFKLNKQSHYARAAETLGVAVAAAQKLAVPACLVVAFLQFLQAGSLQRASDTPGVSPEYAEAAVRKMWLTLLPEAWATLEARRRAGTLLGDGCSRTEQAFYVAFRTAWLVTCSGLLSLAQTEVLVTADAPWVGFHALVRGASLALGSISKLAVGPYAAVLPDRDAFVRVALREVDAAVDAIVVAAGSGSELALGVEATFIQTLSCMVGLEIHSPSGPSAEGAQLLRAWSRLGSIPQMPSIRQGSECALSDVQRAVAGAAASAAHPGLRSCAQDACREREVHPAQFKRCSACSTVVYCCKACQPADWPRHKAACKAARKAAAAPAAQHQLRGEDAAGPSSSSAA